MAQGNRAVPSLSSDRRSSDRDVDSWAAVARCHRSNGRGLSVGVSLIGGFDRSIDGYAKEFDGMAQGAAQLAEREASKEDAAPAAQDGQDGQAVGDADGAGDQGEAGDSE